MKKIFKSALAFMVMITLLLSPASYVLAENPNDTLSNEKYFHWDNTNSKINSNGSFTFSYGWCLFSSRFHPTGTSCSMMIRATYPSGIHPYDVTLVKYDDTSVVVKEFNLTANGSYQYVYISELDPNTDYQLHFHTNPYYSGIVSGDGQLYNVYVY